MSDKLILNPNLDNADGFFDALARAHDGLEKSTSDALNARLIFLLANHIGNNDVLTEALAAAQNSGHQR
ncbi:DUF2783 domain-containing protein [uncultured Shimia sp.]|uniref:DUF2783 domain-containing protein n=1 Tax=uncultured Shimia sp. TaxID=573152 RepID=UPI0025CBBBC9|nr:DUF2783 domain-containing protein [uncultured Shimia sp.]